MKLSKRFDRARQARSLALVTLTSKAAQREAGRNKLHVIGFLKPVKTLRGEHPYQVFVSEMLADPIGIAPEGMLLGVSDIEEWHLLPVLLTEEDKARMAPILRRTWDAIAPDGEQFVDSIDGIVELTCDAGRPCEYGMSGLDYQLLGQSYDQPDTQEWLRRVLNYSTNNYPRDGHRPHAPCRS